MALLTRRWNGYCLCNAGRQTALIRTRVRLHEHAQITLARVSLSGINFTSALGIKGKLLHRAKAS